MIKEIKYGIHTFELYASHLKYTEVQKVIDQLIEENSIQMIKSDPYNIDWHIKSAYLVNNGVRLRIYQSHNKSNGIGFAINPRTLWKQEYQPYRLYQPNKKSWDKIELNFDHLMSELHLQKDCSDMSLSSMDLTMDLWMDTDVDLTEVIRTFWKSNIPHHFKRFELDDPDDPTINDHYFGAATKGIVIKAYDKVYELKKYHRCPEKVADENILRVEISLKREVCLKKFDLERNDSICDMLYEGYTQGYKLLMQYLEKLFPCRGEHVSYKKAEKKIEEEIKDKKLRQQMLFLLKKTSKGAGLDTAIQKFDEQYKDVNHRKLKKVLSAFDKLDLNPITLANVSKTKHLPSLLRMITLHMERI